MIKIKRLTTALLIFAVLLLSVLLAGCFWWWHEEEVPQVEYVTVEYSLTNVYGWNFPDFGYIIGESRQVLVKGENATTVTVVPGIGYKFVKWADTGSTNPTRTDCNVQQSQHFRAIMEGPLIYEINFKSGDGGTVEGELRQRIEHGGSGTPVTAIPDEGYRFVQWSDGDKNATRLIENIVEQYFNEDGNNRITAEFERYERKFQYVYNDATSNNVEIEISINLDNLNSVHFPVPQRDGYIFEGWFSDWHHTVQVADSNGAMLVGKEWLDNDYIYDYVNPEGYLYAKWKASIEVPTYKILMPYVTEIYAEVESLNYGAITIDYVMSDIERELCNTITQRVASYLNAMLNGSVNFIVESYFTTEALTIKNINPLKTESQRDDYYLINVNEVKKISNDYDAVLMTFCLDDYEDKLHVSAGIGGGGKDAQVHMENLTFGIHHSDSYILDDLFDFSKMSMYETWENTINTYIHELIHVLEYQFRIMDNVGLHAALRSNIPRNSSFETMRAFLRGELVLDEQETGVKYEYWSGDKRA